MRSFLRCLGDYRGLQHVWLPLLGLTVSSALLVSAMPLIEKYLIDSAILPARLDLLVEAAILYAVLWLASTVCQSGTAALRTYLGEQVSLRLRQRVFDHAQTLALAFARREHSGRTMALLTSDVPTLANLLSTTLVFGVGSLAALTASAVLMFSLSWQLALVASAAPLAVAAVAAVLTRPLRPAARRAQEKTAELSERLHESLAGVREVVAFGRERAQRTKLTTTLDELLRLRMRISLVETALQTSQSLLSLAITAALLGYGGYLVIQGQVTLGTLVAMRALFGLVLQPAGQVLGLMAGLQRALGCADRLHAFLDEAPRVRERPTARFDRPPAGWVTFDRVSFAYSPGQPVLRDISFGARPGEVVALVGPSGAGKSTLVSLLARLYDPTEGRIVLDGVDLCALRLAELRGLIGVVFQDTFLFATSVRDNIAFGCEGATEEQVIAAARQANAWEFIERLPDGLDTLVGERGTRLSEGQKQRLGIARALVRNPRILILDEPTAALDARSEYLLQAGLEQLMRGRTTFVIAHRLTTIQRADRILALESGRIAQQGTHAELLAEGGLYRELLELQFGTRAA